MSYFIRQANIDDAPFFCRIIRTSIEELCIQDHRSDEQFLNKWLENKTNENCSYWIADEQSTSLVAEEKGTLVGVAHIGHNGHLYLCYLHPNSIGKGIGHALLKTAEQSVIDLGVRQITLESTRTAKAFYEKHDYQPTGVTDMCLQYKKILTHA